MRCKINGKAHSVYKKGTGDGRKGGMRDGRGNKLLKGLTQ